MANRILMVKIYIIIITVLIDIYAFIGILGLLKGQGTYLKLIVSVLYWLVTVLILAGVLYYLRLDTGQRDPAGLSGIFLIFGIYTLIYMPKLVFIAFRGTEDIAWLVSRIVHTISGSTGAPLRHKVISQTGFILSTIPFLAILWGLVFGRFHYQIEDVEIRFSNLPASFDGLKIVQLSDIHLGSVYGKEKKLQKAVDIVNSLEPDLVLFTGDLVNSFTEEAHGWEKMFAGIHARVGKYSVLGNHDYGDYWGWKSVEEQAENLRMLLDVHRDMGFRLLRNEWDTIGINGERIALVGVENWGLPPFKQYGDLQKSLQGVPENAFKILLSHDPSHWDAQVNGKTDIPLTLSGHTHAMQFGVKLGRFQWSPSKYMYKRWMGLYRENGQSLYVNRGLGFIGFPGRIGLRPEITRITLRKDNKSSYLN